MTQWAFPLLSIDGDRQYSDGDFAQFYKLMHRTGIFITAGDALRVKSSPDGGMRVIVSTGGAFINGRGYMNTEDLAMQIPVASSSQDRLDSIVLRLNLDSREIKLVHKVNSISVERTEQIFELQLATINVQRNTVNIFNENITDKRSDEAVCGYSSPYEEVSVSGLEQQYNDMLQRTFDEFVARADNNQLDLEQLLTDQQATFQNWLSNLQNQLDDNQATNLQNQIDRLTANNEVIEIEHDLERYPNVQVLYWEYGLGTVPLEEQPEEISWDGTSPETIDFKAYHDSSKKVRIHVPIDYAMTNPVVTELTENKYLLVDGIKSLQIDLV